MDGRSDGLARRRSTVFLRLDSELARAADEAVSLGLAATRRQFGEDSVRARLREIRHARMRQLAAEAMADPGFVADMHEVMNDFR